jgi:hypothetical protein
MAPNIQLAIPERRSEAQANPESSNPQQRLLDSGFTIIGLRPMISPRNDHAYDSNFGCDSSFPSVGRGRFPASGDRAKGGNGVGESG